METERLDTKEDGLCENLLETLQLLPFLGVLETRFFIILLII